MSSYELAICIPTYNRDKYLNELLESIWQQLNFDNNKKVQICISDNASSDNTLTVVEKWKAVGNLNIYYSCNKQNEGADFNYLKAVSLSNAEYCWIMGSDDKIAPGSIEFILNMIKHYKYDILITDRMECDINMKPIKIRSFFIKSNLEWDFFKNDSLEKYFNNANCLGGVFSYISSIIFRKKIWVIDNNVEKFVGTAYVHVYILLGSLIRGCTIKHINKPLVFCRLGNDSFASEGIIKRILLDFEGYLKLADYYFSYDRELYNSFLKILKREHPFRRLITIQNHSAMKKFHKYLKICGWSEFQIKLAYYFRWLYSFKRLYRFIVFVCNKLSNFFSKNIIK